MNLIKGIIVLLSLTAFASADSSLSNTTYINWPAIFSLVNTTFAGWPHFQLFKLQKVPQNSSDSVVNPIINVTSTAIRTPFSNSSGVPFYSPTYLSDSPSGTAASTEPSFSGTSDPTTSPSNPTTTTSSDYPTFTPTGSNNHNGNQFGNRRKKKKVHEEYYILSEVTRKKIKHKRVHDVPWDDRY